MISGSDGHDKQGGSGDRPATGAVGLGSDAACEGLWDQERSGPTGFFLVRGEHPGKTRRDDLRNELVIDCRREEQRIIEFARQAIARLHRKGAVIGLSGGLDSSLCAYLLEKAPGRRKILALLLPERDSSPVHRRHARRRLRQGAEDDRGFEEEPDE